MLDCSKPEDLHKVIKHGVVSRRKAGHCDASGSLIFKFSLLLGRQITEMVPPSLSLVELSSGSLLGGFQKVRVKKGMDIPWTLRALEAVYDGSVVKGLARLLLPSSKTSFCFLFNHTQTDDEAADSLLELSQFINESEPTPALGAISTRDKVSSGIKLILSKKSAKKSDQKRQGDKTSSRIEENPRRKELFR
jgi:hypothetical protein